MDFNIKNAVLISNMISLDNAPITKLIRYYKRNHLNSYFLLKYDKMFFNLNDLYVGLYHSVLFSYPNKKLLSFCPSKLTTYKYFRTLFPKLDENIQITEHVDGVLVNLYFDEIVGEWEITTKNNIGGYESLYDDEEKMTVKEGFVSNLGYLKNTNINEMSILEYFSKDFCYSFKLCKKRSYILYIIGIHMIKCDVPNNVKFIPESTFMEWKCIQTINGLVHFPKKISFPNYKELDEHLNYCHEPIKYVLTNEKTAIKCFLQNNEYYTQESFDQIDNFNKYLFLCLNRNFNSYEMRINLPANERELFNTRIQFENLITDLFNAYINYFIKKKSLSLPSKYKNHLLLIHKKYYLESLKKKCPFLVKRGTIKEYMNKLSPNELMHLLTT